MLLISRATRSERHRSASRLTNHFLRRSSPSWSRRASLKTNRAGVMGTENEFIVVTEANLRRGRMKIRNTRPVAALAAIIVSVLVSGRKLSRADDAVPNSFDFSVADSAAGEKRDLVITRMFDAPVELVWKAWTEPEYVMRWWGPKNFTSPSCRIDFREGGKFVFHMRAPKDFQGGQD